MRGVVSIFVLVAGLAAAAVAQQPQPAPAQEKADLNRVIGEVTAIDAAGGQLSVKIDAGAAVTVLLSDKTLYLRVPPGEKDLKKAARIALADVAVGDRVYARGRLSQDQKSIPATAVIIMTKADIARKHDAERAEWQSRGVAGTVTALNSQTKEVTIQVGSRNMGRTVTIEPAENVRCRRYAPDSVRFADAKPSSLAELKVGDLVRVLGDKNPDGSRIQAEEIVSGSFRNIAGQVKTVDAAAGEIRITDLETKQPLIVHVNSDSLLRRLPEMMAMMMARRLQAADAGAPNRGPAVRPAAGAPPQAGAGPRGPGNLDFQQMLERMPVLTLAELKPGDALIVSSTAGADPSSVTAITIVAGVEPFLTASSNGPQMGGLGGMPSFDIGLP